jgi:alpha-glucosidase
MFAILLTTLTGTLFIYQGQEIGMTNFPDTWAIEEYKDYESIKFYTAMKGLCEREQDESARKDIMRRTMDGLAKLARDHARTPVQWDDSPNAGFTTGKPWMRVNDNYREINVKQQLDKPDSVLNFWRRAIALRKQHKDTFIRGEFTEYGPENPALFTYTKTATTGPEPRGRVLVVLNFSGEAQRFEKPAAVNGDLRLLLGNIDKGSGRQTLQAYEARIYVVEQ